jgi:hypothetical protein
VYVSRDIANNEEICSASFPNLKKVHVSMYKQGKKEDEAFSALMTRRFPEQEVNPFAYSTDRYVRWIGSRS